MYVYSVHVLSHSKQVFFWVYTTCAVILQLLGPLEWNFLESCLGWSVIVPEFQGDSGISAFIAAV
jgi:hypothetical protein